MKQEDLSLNEENSPEDSSVVRRHALPLMVIVSSWFCGLIACGETCSFAVSPVTMLTNHPSGKVRLAAWAWWLLAVLFGVYVGLHVGKAQRRRYREENK